MKKHVKIHEEPTKICKFYIQNTECPFEQLGCKFLHEDSRNEKNDSDDEIMKEDDGEIVIEDNFCYFCERDFDDPTSLGEHTIADHMDLFTKNVLLLSSRTS